MPQSQTPVLIVGSGLAGLTTATLLAWRGIPVMLVERHARTSLHPRARSVNVRSMELLRVAGLEPELLEAGKGTAGEFSIIVAESVTGQELKTILPRGNWDTTELSPARMSTAGQDRIEPVLRKHAEALGADLRYSTELVSFEQDDDGVSARLRDLVNGTESLVRADYLVAADGHRSPIRKLLGIGMHGIGSISHNLGILFEAGLEPVLKGRGTALYYLQNPQFNGVFINTDTHNRAFVSVEYDANKECDCDFDTARCQSIVRAAIGIPDLDVSIVEVASWEMSSRMADSMRAGRIFLAGDCAHTMPPTGGLGGQTAMQDGYDLAWKLALVIRGYAGPELLSTYEAERMPVGEMTVNLQTANYIERLRPDRKDLVVSTGMPDYVSVAMGYRYRSRSIVADGPDDGSLAESPMEPTGQPGTRGAHVAFEYKGSRVSSVDLIGRDFVLLTGPEGAAWARAGTALEYEHALPLSVYRVGIDLLDVEQKWPERYGVTAAGAVLLRPDGYIAWRARTAASSPKTILRDAFAKVLARDPATLAAGHVTSEPSCKLAQA